MNLDIGQTGSQSCNGEFPDADAPCVHGLLRVSMTIPLRPPKTMVEKPTSREIRTCMQASLEIPKFDPKSVKRVPHVWYVQQCTQRSDLCDPHTSAKSLSGAHLSSIMHATPLNPIPNAMECLIHSGAVTANKSSRDVLPCGRETESPWACLVSE